MLVDIPYFRIRAYHQTGSSVICNPPVIDTDIDFVVFVTNKEVVCKTLVEAGWNVCGNEAYTNPDSNFIALRKGKLNYILVDDETDYDRWEAAMLLARHRNLTVKADRIELFRRIKAGVGKKTKKDIFQSKFLVQTEKYPF